MLELVEPGLLAEDLAWPHLQHPAALDRKLHLALEHDAEALVDVALAHQPEIAADLAPGADPHHLPQVDVLELGEESELAQAREALGVMVHVAFVEDLVAHRGEVLGELGAIAVARVQILLERLADYRVHLLGHVRVELRDRGRIGIDDLVDELGRIVRAERQPTGQHVEEQHAERIQVGLLVERIALDLLRAHVGRRAHAHDEGRVGVELLVDVEREAEVGDLHVVLLVDQDVRRLDVAVHDALAVGVVERHAALENDPDRAVDRQQVLEAAVALERAAGEVLHHHIGLVGLDRGVVDTDDVGVVEAAGHHALGLQQLDQAAVPLRLVARLVVEAHVLERHRLGVVRGLGEIDHRGRAATDLLDDPVLADAFGNPVHAVLRGSGARAGGRHRRDCCTIRRRRALPGPRPRGIVRRGPCMLE